MKDKFKLTGRVVIRINGEIVRDIKNLVVTAGHDWIASRMGGAGDAVMSHMAIGDGSTAAVIADTVLDNEIYRAALNTAGGVVLDNTITFELTLAADVPDVTAPATTTIKEAGIFNHATVGDMLARTVFSTVEKAETDTMTISWTITVE
jgi:hypothetical protein